MKNEDKKILKPELRRIVLISGAFYLGIPKKVVDRYNIKAGDIYTIVAKEGTLTAMPMQGD